MSRVPTARKPRWIMLRYEGFSSPGRGKPVSVVTVDAPAVVASTMRRCINARWALRPRYAGKVTPPAK